ncbi:MAG TPA: N-acetylmuramoyl-L-alanine amidase, partial [Acidimicrobiales bacterium]
MTRAVAFLLALVALTVTAACSDGSTAGGTAGTSPSSTPTSAIVSTTLPPSTTSTTTTTLPPLVEDGVARAVTTPTGIVAAVVDRRADGSYVVLSPCGDEVPVHNAMPIVDAHVVLDPGHGGSESGAIGPRGTREAEINLAVAEVAKAELERAGVSVVLTRTGDYRITLASR